MSSIMWKKFVFSLGRLDQWANNALGLEVLLDVGALPFLGHRVSCGGLGEEGCGGIYLSSQLIKPYKGGDVCFQVRPEPSPRSGARTTESL